MLSGGSGVSQVRSLAPSQKSNNRNLPVPHLCNRGLEWGSFTADRLFLLRVSQT